MTNTNHLDQVTLINVTTDAGVETYRRNKLTRYQRETLTHLYAAVAYLEENELPTDVLEDAITDIEAQA